jgi:hypothetical protein
MVEMADPRLLRMVQQADAERTRRIKAERQAVALKFQVSRLRQQVKQLTTDGRPIRDNAPSR